MKHLSLKRVLVLALCLCLAVTLLTAFSHTRSVHASTCQTLRYAPGNFLIEAGDTPSNRVQWTTCAGNTMSLHMQSDGNFVLYLNGQSIWASNTSGILVTGGWVRFQSDSNLVVYDHNAVPGLPVTYAAWWSGTNGKNATALELQSDGNMVIYSASGAIWSSRTNGH